MELHIREVVAQNRRREVRCWNSKQKVFHVEQDSSQAERSLVEIDVEEE